MFPRLRNKRNRDRDRDGDRDRDRKNVCPARPLLEWAALSALGTLFFRSWADSTLTVPVLIL
jgi:hypothetical protein